MITTLKKNPEKFKETLDLIHEAFDYSTQNSFYTDFYPLINENNHANNFILLNNGSVAGHIGLVYKQYLLHGSLYNVAMLGGVAIGENYRGKGFLKSFLTQVIETIKDTPFILLWSDKIDLYKKFNFHPCIEQYEYTGAIESDNPHFIRMKLKELNEQDIARLSNIYNTSNELRFLRTIDDWNELKHIDSSDIYIKKENGIIENYFFMNKGEDLSEIIYEYGHLKDIEEISTYGILWSPMNFEVEKEEDKSILYAALLKINTHNLFKDFITKFTSSIIDITRIDETHVQFLFENEIFNLEHEDFLQGIFGPDKFQELNKSPKILISGLDSI